MTLSKEAQHHYNWRCGEGLRKMNRTVGDDVNRILFSKPRSGPRNRAAGNVLIKHWENLVNVKLEALAEAYELDNHNFDKDDVERFICRLQSASRVMATARCKEHPKDLNLGRILKETEEINRRGRLKLIAIMNRKNLETKANRRMKKKETPSVNIRTGPNSIVQFKGRNKASLSVMVNAQFDQTINQLRQVFEGSKELDEFDQDDAIDAINRLPPLATKQLTPRVLDRIKETVSKIADIATKSKDIAAIAYPLVEKIKEYWPNISW